MRLFVAVDFPPSVNDRLIGLCNGVPGAKWVSAGQLHLTLRFIGEVDNGTFADIAEALSEVAAAPFAMRLEGVGHFPPRGAPRVLWAGVGDGAPLARLHHKIEAQLRRLGLPPDRRKFAPHVTLARLRQAHLRMVRDYLVQHAPFATEDFPVSEFHLYSSRLGGGTALHRIEASYALGEVG